MRGGDQDHRGHRARRSSRPRDADRRRPSRAIRRHGEAARGDRRRPRPRCHAGHRARAGPEDEKAGVGARRRHDPDCLQARSAPPARGSLLERHPDPGPAHELRRAARRRARHSRRCAHDDRWGRLSMNGNMYRREFLRRSALAAASVAVFACAPSATVPAASAALKPVKGGTLTWGLWDKIDVIDPALTTGAASGEIAQNILDTLITIDGDQKLYPALASKWTITDSSKTFTFTLRDGVKFHDGSTLTSAAVKGSFDRILDPKTKAGAVVSLVGPIDKITTPDDKTVVFSFKQPYPAFMLQIWRYFFGVVSPKYLATLKPGDVAAEPVGSGPFMFAGRSTDGVVAIKAFPDYNWGTELFKNRAAPYLDQLKFRAITEPSTRVATLESGENLFIDEIPLATFRSPWTEIAQAMQSQLRDVGIDLKVQVMERGPYLDYVRGYKHNMAATSSTAIDPDGILRVCYHSANRVSGSNFSNTNDPQLDALLVKGQSQDLSTPERKQTYVDAQKRVMEILPFVGVMSQVRVEAMSTKVHDFKPGPDGLTGTAMNDVWLEG